MEPKVILNLVDKKGKSYRMQGLATKVKKRSLSSFMKRAKLNDFKKLTVEVKYGKDVANSMNCRDYTDLRWAMEAFLDKNLYI